MARFAGRCLRGSVAKRCAPGFLFLFSLCMTQADPAFAVQPNRGANVVRVANDAGGQIAQRAELVAQLRARGTTVQIVGGCYSACTMYLAVPDVCVRRNARLGFHGPSSQHYGISLTPAAFDYWSRIMAEHYPEPLRGWFLREGRNSTLTMTYFHGTELIGMGIRECGT